MPRLIKLIYKRTVTKTRLMDKYRWCSCLIGMRFQRASQFKSPNSTTLMTADNFEMDRQLGNRGSNSPVDPTKANRLVIMDNGRPLDCSSISNWLLSIPNICCLQSFPHDWRKEGSSRSNVQLLTTENKTNGQNSKGESNNNNKPNQPTTIHTAY